MILIHIHFPEIQLCQEWLHKLLKIDEKTLRNAHIVQFIMQLKNGVLNESFNQRHHEDNESLLPLVSYLPTVRNFNLANR